MTAPAILTPRSLDPRASDYEPRSVYDLPKAPHNTLPDEESALRVKRMGRASVPRVEAPFTRAEIDWYEIERVNHNEGRGDHAALYDYIDRHGGSDAGERVRASLRTRGGR